MTVNCDAVIAALMMPTWSCNKFSNGGSWLSIDKSHALKSHE